MYPVIVPIMFDRPYFKREKALHELRRIEATQIALILERDLRYTFSSPETLENLRDTICYFKENGFSVIVWLGETFGHSLNPPYTELPYTPMRILGKGDRSPFCPLDPEFQKAFCCWVSDVAACHPDMILLDDDYRLAGRYEIGMSPPGCCCDLHMAALEKLLGEPITEQQLCQKAFHGCENRYRDAWMQVCEDSMLQFSRLLRQAIDRVDPNCRLGSCCTSSNWDYSGDCITLARALAGNTKPFLRLCSAPYWANYEKKLGDTVEIIRTQAAWCREQGVEIVCEGDTYPRPRFATPAAYLSCYDMILRAAGETDGILNYALDYTSHPDYETGYVDFCEKNKAHYQLISRLFGDKTAIGIRPYQAMRLLKHRQMDGDLIPIQDNLYSASIRVPVCASLPITYQPGGVQLVFGEHARHICPEALKDGAVIDLTAAKILMQRGVDVGVAQVDAPAEYASRSFSESAVEYFIGQDQYTPLTHLTHAVTYMPGAEVLTRLCRGKDTYPGAARYENALGMRFLILPVEAESAPYGFFETYARGHQFWKAIDWLGRKPLPVALESRNPYLYVLMKQKREKLVIGLWNLYPDRVDDLVLSLRVPVEDVEFWECDGCIREDTLRLTTPLYPYEFAAIALTIKENTLD